MNTEQALLKLRKSIREPRSVLALTGLAGTSSAWLIARLLRSVNHPRAGDVWGTLPIYIIYFTGYLI